MDMTGRNTAITRSRTVISPVRCPMSSAWVKTAAIGPAAAIRMTARQAMVSMDTFREKRNASRTMSLRPMAYSLEHAATIAPPTAWAGTIRT